MQRNTKVREIEECNGGTIINLSITNLVLPFIIDIIYRVLYFIRIILLLSGASHFKRERGTQNEHTYCLKVEIRCCSCMGSCLEYNFRLNFSSVVLLRISYKFV